MRAATAGRSAQTPRVRPCTDLSRGSRSPSRRRRRRRRRSSLRIGHSSIPLAHRLLQHVILFFFAHRRSTLLLPASPDTQPRAPSARPVPFLARAACTLALCWSSLFRSSLDPGFVREDAPERARPSFLGARRERLFLSTSRLHVGRPSNAYHSHQPRVYALLRLPRALRERLPTDQLPPTLRLAHHVLEPDADPVPFGVRVGRALDVHARLVAEGLAGEERLLRVAAVEVWMLVHFEADAWCSRVRNVVSAGPCRLP